MAAAQRSNARPPREMSGSGWAIATKAHGQNLTGARRPRAGVPCGEIDPLIGFFAGCPHEIQISCGQKGGRQNARRSCHVLAGRDIVG